ncbi:MarR family transcriptional regulator [Bifidobacterium lemurum]|uniref:MarR family transcriptional regulator n=1 Tax=Bifidobacterium lemurum TaxID=1603886 RepID=A0A261FPG4_9BIFI|nr:ArsR family transcriptional regulator [Bifidobacterium lemurum]OZG60706.1 MarR family transcriptional regulator [Bifidobacterium lemurum]QOL35239.1 winged helix-turn-helix transcriptional regulator [Bifidobacterium lemurum]
MTTDNPDGRDTDSDGTVHRPSESLPILNRCIPLFETLKDEQRQSLLVRLVMDGPLTVGQLAEASPLSRTTVSHHIKLLAQSGLVTIEKDETRRICTVRAEENITLLQSLVDALRHDLEAARQCREENTPAAGTA